MIAKGEGGVERDKLGGGINVYMWASLVAQLVKNPPSVQETVVRFLGQEAPLEKGPAIHSSILA